MATTAPPDQASKEQLLEWYRTMRTIREFEERLHKEFATGEIPGFVHLYAGEEAIATGVPRYSTVGQIRRAVRNAPASLH